MIRRLLAALVILQTFSRIAFPAEGMWIPLLIEKFHIEEMREQGFRLSADDIYSINKACLKDAVVLFGNGCTGEVISPEGLLLTNHHCGYGKIQSHSSVENDYLTDGFWAYSKDEELPNPGLSVSFLVRMEDVTEKVLGNLDEITNEKQRQLKIAQRIRNIKDKSTQGTHYIADIKPFYFGKEYYLFIYEKFTDVRLVGAPPSSIGKFGGDTDNWMWPRHTGDFSLFRIYADSENKPADYSPDNVPYTPKKYLNLSVKGIKENDFTMILGYPARTEEYLTSEELKLIVKESLPRKIELRNIRLNSMKKAMEESPEIRIKYASKYASISNAWKKWIGEIKGIERFNAIEKKIKLEADFTQWLNDNPEYKEQYGKLLPEFTQIYKQLKPYYIANDFGNEAVLGVELLDFISNFFKSLDFISNTDEVEMKKSLDALKKQAVIFFANYEIEIDKKIFPKMLESFYTNVDKQFHPEFFNRIMKKYKGDYKKFTDDIYEKSIFANQEKLIEILDKFALDDIKEILNDPAFQVYISFSNIFSTKVYPTYENLTKELENLYDDYLEALMLMQPGKLFYPDANHTMRLTYGKIQGYSPANAIDYYYLTTLKGVMEKDNPEIYDYDVPDKLKDLFEKKDFGPYTQNGSMPVCFIASNHTSGGNSGSPVLNADGYLIGVNFDRNWEGTMSDYMYDPSMCRNISLDIRYVLFIIEKFAEAHNLIKELTIIN